MLLKLSQPKIRMLLSVAQLPKIELRPLVLPLEVLWSAMLPGLICLPFRALGSEMFSRLIYLSFRALWSDMLARLVALMLGSHWSLMKTRPLRLIAFPLRLHRLVIKLRPIGAIAVNVGSLRTRVDFRPIGAIVRNIGALRVRVNLWPFGSLRLVSFDQRSLESIVVSFTWQFVVRPFCVIVSSILFLKVEGPWMIILPWALTWIDDPFSARFSLFSGLSLRLPAHLNILNNFLKIIAILLLLH